MVTRVGYEWRRGERKFRYYFGLDGYFEYISFQHNNVLVYNQGYIKSILDENTFKIGLSAFSGASVQINKRISIFIESNLLLSYSKYVMDSEGFEYPIDDPSTRAMGSDIQKNWNVEFSPLYFLGLSYHFN